MSETFIKSQADALVTFDPYFAGIRRLKRGLELSPHPILLASASPALDHLYGKIYKMTRHAPRFHHRVARVKPVLIHAHFAPDAVTALPLSEELKVPLLVTLHGYDVTVRRDFRKSYEALWSKARLFLCVSDFIWRKALEAGFPAEKLIRHYIGINCEEFARSPEAQGGNTVLFVGRLVEKKGCADLIRAFKLVQRQNPEAELVMIGAGPLRKQLESLAADLELSCRFLGTQPTSVVKYWISKAGVLCAPSVTAANGDSEGLPVVILEAQAMGVPVVSTFHAGIPEGIVNGDTGLLAEEGDVSSIATHLLFYLDDAASRKTAGERGKAWIEARFNLKSQTRLLEDMYERVCA